MCSIRITCQGAACMNNTFCLGIFMALVYFQVDVLRPVLVNLVSLSIGVLKYAEVLQRSNVRRAWLGSLRRRPWPSSLLSPAPSDSEVISIPSEQQDVLNFSGVMCFKLKWMEWGLARFALAGIVLMNHNQRVVDVSLSEKGYSVWILCTACWAPLFALSSQARHWFYFSIVKSKSWKIGIKAFGIFLLFPGALVLASAQIELEVTLQRWKPKPEALWLCLSMFKAMFEIFEANVVTHVMTTCVLFRCFSVLVLSKKRSYLLHSFCNCLMP